MAEETAAGPGLETVDEEIGLEIGCDRKSNGEAIRDADARDEAKTIKAPVLVISGTHDQSTTAAQGRELAGYIAGSRYVELDAAHLSNIEQADVYTKTLLEFLGA